LRKTSLTNTSSLGEITSGELATTTWDASIETHRKSQNQRKLSKQGKQRQEGGDVVVKLLSKPRDQFFKRVAEFEKIAKQLEKDLNEKANLHDINQYFDKMPAYLE
jgi:hypothetical protein